jgi:hypothetical protein
VGRPTSDQPRPRAHSLKDGFAILGLSYSQGHGMVRDGRIRVIRYTPDMPRITDDEIERILREGLVAPRKIIRRPTKRKSTRKPLNP